MCFTWHPVPPRDVKLPRLSPIGTGARAWRGDSGCGAGIVPPALFGGGAPQLALKRELDWQEQPLVVPLVHSRAQLKTWLTQTVIKSPGRRGDVTSRKGGNNPATWLKGGREPSLFFACADPACGWVAKQRNSWVPPEPRE